jgi:signal transduction histidine kinase
VIVAFPLLKPGSNKTQGVALGVLKFERILKLVASQGARIEIAIAYNEPAFARKLIYSSVGNPAASRGIKDWARQSDYSRETEFDVAGRHFVLGLRAPPSATSWMGFLEPLGAALLVIALAALLAQHLYATIVARQAVERAVVLRTRQLQNANAALEEEIRSRREVEADLRAAKEKAEGANSAKSEFLATMSHELRTPLNAIIGFSSMLAQTPADQRSQEACVDYITQIHEGGIRLLGLINDLLDLTQMDSGRLRLDEDIVPVEDLIDTAVAKMGARAEAASVRLSARVQDGLLPLRADERRLLKALTALLSNAIKFSPRGGSAEITARRSADGGLCVEVRDMGVGIPKGQERRILEPFIQLDSTLARSHEGAGLGLTFVKRVAELHDATLSIASDLGKGTCVTLSFPASRVVKTAEVA